MRTCKNCKNNNDEMEENEDINVNSETFGEDVGPPIYEGMISGYYFGKAG